MGWSSDCLGPVSQLFVDFCAATTAPVLDIGAGYGKATVAALEAGARVIANDLDARHLEDILRLAPELLRPRLELRAGRFPRDLHFEPASLASVHASSVFHFLTGNQLVRGLKEIGRWLQPGGKLFLQTATPYQSPFESFIRVYDERKQAGERWPGWIPKLSVHANHKQLSQMPRSLHLLDDVVLRELAGQAGLLVERAWLYRRKDLPSSLHWDGRESAGLVAAKSFA